MCYCFLTVIFSYLLCIIFYCFFCLFYFFFFFFFFLIFFFFFFFQAEDGIRDADVTGDQTCALPISGGTPRGVGRDRRVLQVGHDQERLEQLVDARALQRRDGDHLGVAAPVAGDQPLLGQLLLDPGVGRAAGRGYGGVVRVTDVNGVR